MFDRCLPLALATLVFACATPLAPTAPTPDPPVLSTRERLENLIVELELEPRSPLAPKQLETALALGFEVEELIELVEP
jgi:hypothetical protein